MPSSNRFSGLWRPVARQVLAAAATNIDFTGLNGDQLKKVRIEIRTKNNGAGTATITLQPNSLATNQRSSALEKSTGAAITGFDTTTLYMGVIYTTGLGSEIITEFSTDKSGGMIRAGFSSCLALNGAGTAITYDQTAMEWNETATLITSLRINSDVASAFAIGTEALLFAR